MDKKKLIEKLKEKEREKNKEREREKLKEKEREKNKEREKLKEKEREKNKEREKLKDILKEKDKNILKRISKNAKNIPNFIPAYKIMNLVSGCGYIEDYVNEILPVIRDDIQKTIDADEKMNYSITEIPTTFDVPGMENKRAQIYIYFHLLRALKKAEYFPKIKIEGTDHNQRVFIYVKWFSPEDIKMERYMDAYIKSHKLD